MRLQTYSLALMATAMGLFLAVIATNLIVDPEEVLGTGLIGHSINPNRRYTAMRAYEAAPGVYDGLMFGSSRSYVMPLDALSQRMGGANFASFAVSAGQIVDHLAVLEYIIRTKAARGQALRSVFVLLDADLFGEIPPANRSIQFLWPPALTGESPWRFTWRYLTAIQFKTWRTEIGRVWPALRQTAEEPGSAVAAWSGISAASAASAAEQPLARAAEINGPARERITARRDFPNQLALLARFVELCRTHHIALAVALSPLHRVNAIRYDLDDLGEVALRIADVVPVWDFGVPEWLSARPDLWTDYSHFTPVVAKMMLDRVFTGEAADAPPGFGVLRGH